MVKTRLDQRAFCAFHSFLVDVQTKLDTHVLYMRNDNQAPVVQTLDSTIYRINHYLEDKYLGNQLHYPVDRDLSFG